MIIIAFIIDLREMTCDPAYSLNLRFLFFAPQPLLSSSLLDTSGASVFPHFCVRCPLLDSLMLLLLHDEIFLSLNRGIIFLLELRSPVNTVFEVTTSTSYP